MISRYLSIDKTSRFAVELSGGLDTALIIVLLRAFGIEPILIGIESSRYEFRTERAIQEYFRSTARQARLIPQSKIRAFGNLTQVPCHALPDPASLYYVRHQTIAEMAASLGARHVLTGDTGDNLLSLDISSAGMEVIRSHDRWGLSKDWVDTFVYEPLGLHCISAFSLQDVARTLLGMREGCAADPMKLWARRQWSALLPYELSHYAYKASHDNWIVDCLSLAADEISKVAARAYDMLPIQSLAPAALLQDSERYVDLDIQQQHRFLETLAFSTWLHSHAETNPKGLQSASYGAADKPDSRLDGMCAS